MLPTRCRSIRFIIKSTRSKSTSQHDRQIIDPTTNILKSPYSDVVIPDLNLSEYIWRKADRWKHWPALTDAKTGRSYTYGEARAASERLTVSLLDSAGLKPGDTLGLVMPNSPEFALALIGAVGAGLVASPANPVYTTDELTRQMTDCGARAVVTVPELLDKVVRAMDKVPGGGAVIVATDGSGAEETALAAQHPGVLSLHALLRREHARRTPRPPRPDQQALAALPYSSGTTGVPKGVRLTHRNLIANLCQLEHPEIVGQLPEASFQDVSLAVLPFYHIYGLTGIMNFGLSVGRHTVIVPKFEATDFARAFSQYKPSVLSLVPPLMMFLINSDKVAVSDMSRLRFVTTGAAPLTPSLIQDFMKKAKKNDLDFREGFGMTETSCCALFTPSWSGLSKLGSCGFPLPLTEAKIIDDEGNALPLGREGELLVRGPQVMQGYHNNELATRETLTEDGWLKTGDKAYADDGGFVFLVDRLKELIKVKGLQVSPTELEGLLRKMKGISDVAVMGIPDEKAGEVPRAFVVRAASSTISEEDVGAFLEPQVAPFKRLAGGVQFVNEIPKSAAGKILRKTLKQMYM